MEVLEAIKTRRSIKKFLDKPVPWDLISNVLDAGRYAPSAGNLQNWKFIAVLDQGIKSAIAEACVRQLWIARAPCVIVIFSEPEKAERYYDKKGSHYSSQNCAAAAMNMLLEAHNQGLGANWIGAFDEDMIKRSVGAESFAVPEVVIALGYPDENPPMPARLPLEVVGYINKWRGKMKDVSAYFYYYSPHVQAAAKKTVATAKKAVEKTAETASKIAKKIKEKF